MVFGKLKNQKPSPISPETSDVSSVTQADDARQEQHQKTEASDQTQNCIEGVRNPDVGAG